MVDKNISPLNDTQQCTSKLIIHTKHTLAHAHTHAGTLNAHTLNNILNIHLECDTKTQLDISLGGDQQTCCQGDHDRSNTYNLTITGLK